jgi:rRNA maturation endonuclease Nob1
MLEKLKQRMEQVRDKGEDVAIGLLTNKVSDDIQKYRYDICQGCEKLYKPTDTCKMCGCFMKVKTWMPLQKCPIDKWPTVENK